MLPVDLTAPMPPTLVELHLGKVIRVYERVKLGLLLAVLFINIAILGGLLAQARTNHQALVQTRKTLAIVACAVDKGTTANANGDLRTPADTRTALRLCLEVAR